MNYWTLTLPSEDIGSLPILTRGTNPAKVNKLINGAITNQLSMKTYSSDSAPNDFIDVVSDFQWTKNPISSRQDVPRVYMYEKRILTNSLIANAAYSVFATLDGGATIAETAKELVDVGSGGIITSAVAKFKDSDTGKRIQEQLDKLKSSGESSFTQFNNPALKPYSGLYITENTGFQYIMPYLDNNYFDGSASYGDGQVGLAAGVSEIISNIAEGIANIAGAIRPGVYIERSKQYSFGDQGRTINLSFPLLNTGSFADISHNWQLIFALIYQNRPGRYDKNLIDLPVIYSIEVPGTVSLPYAYISKLTVSFLGNRRLMNIPIPKIIDTTNNDVNGEISSIEKIQTIVPDAYKVDITITGLNEETRNFLFAGLRQNQVTVTTSKPNTLNSDVIKIKKPSIDDVLPKTGQIV